MKTNNKWFWVSYQLGLKGYSSRWFYRRLNLCRRKFFRAYEMFSEQFHQDQAFRGSIARHGHIFNFKYPSLEHYLKMPITLTKFRFRNESPLLGILNYIRLLKNSYAQVLLVFVLLSNTQVCSAPVRLYVIFRFVVVFGNDWRYFSKFRSDLYNI